jgi:hypothetical protein
MNEDKKVYPTDKTSTAVIDKTDANLDPITGQPGAHPVGTGVGAAGGAVTGAALGAAVGGPVGAVVGAAIGGVAGGLAGKGVAEGINPTEEDAYWRNNYSKRPYAANRSFDDLEPAYKYGYTSAGTGTYAGRKFNDAEGDLQHGWEQAKGKSGLAWSDAKYATKDAWNRVAGRTENDSYWRENHTTQPYAKDRSYDDYAPAYRYGYDSASTHAGRKFDEAENDLQHGWEQAKGKSGLAWSDAKHAVKNSWHRVERALPGDADGDGY